MINIGEHYYIQICGGDHWEREIILFILFNKIKSSYDPEYGEN